MKKRVLLAMAATFILIGMLMAASCSQKALQSESEVIAPPQVSEAAPETTANTDPPAEMPQEPVQAEPVEPIAAAASVEPAPPAEPALAFENIHFAYDSAQLSDQAQEILTNKADYLRTHPAVTLVVEGHCDERGTQTYNQALGQRRAAAVKNFLVGLGVAADRLTTVSYGEERPIAVERTQAAWARNRRAQFIVD